MRFAFASLLLLVSGTACATPPVATPVIAPMTMPCALIKNLCYLQGSFGGARNLSLALDTGSSISVIDRAHESALGLAPSDSGTADGIGRGGDQTYHRFDAVRVDFAGQSLPSETIVGIPLDYIASRNGFPSDGLLGANVFNHFVVDTDYVRGNVAFIDPSAGFAPPDRDVIPTEVSTGVPFVDAAILLPDGHELAGRFLIDSGQLGAGVMLYDAFQRAHPEIFRGLKLNDTHTSGVGGAIALRTGTLSGLRLGRFRTMDITTVFTVDAGGIAKDPRLAGAIGADFLAKFDVAFDYPHGRIFLRPNANFALPFPRNRSGLSVLVHPPEFHTFYVERVSPQSPGDLAGIRAGDRITAVDGHPTASCLLTEILDHFDGVGPALHRLELLRDGKTVRVELRLR